MESVDFHSVDREFEAKEYLENHKIFELFTNLTSHLVFHKPDEPREFIVDYLEKLKKAKNVSLNPPTLFEEQNIQSIFGMLDPTGRGFINCTQYSQAMETLGIKDYEKKPEGHDTNEIKLDTFVKEAKKKLNKVNATFKAK